MTGPDARDYALLVILAICGIAAMLMLISGIVARLRRPKRRRQGFELVFPDYLSPDVETERDDHGDGAMESDEDDLI